MVPVKSGWSWTVNDSMPTHSTQPWRNTMENKPGMLTNDSWLKGCSPIGFVWKCIVYPEKPNGFADHDPYEKWLFHWGYTPFSDIPNSRAECSNKYTYATRPNMWKIPAKHIQKQHPNQTLGLGSRRGGNTIKWGRGSPIVCAAEGFFHHCWFKYPLVIWKPSISMGHRKTMAMLVITRGYIQFYSVLDLSSVHNTNLLGIVFKTEVLKNTRPVPRLPSQGTHKSSAPGSSVGTEKAPPTASAEIV